MQKVITVSEESHGFLCVAKDFQSAIDFLINDHWITEATEVYDDPNGGWLRLDEMFEDNWEESIRNLSRESFEELFTDMIYIFDEDVYGT
jgi:hypothetical protein